MQHWKKIKSGGKKCFHSPIWPHRVCAVLCITLVISLRRKRFQSSYSTKVRVGAKKKNPSPLIPFFFCSRPNFLDGLAWKRLLCRLARDISHREKIRPYYFLLVLFNISCQNLMSNQLFFQPLITCLLECVRYCKEKLHPDQYWEWRFSIGQTNSKCTFLVTLRKQKLSKVRKPSWKVCWFLCKITMVVWHLCGSLILEGTSFKSFLFAILPSYDTYSKIEALRPQERTRTST